MRAFPLRASSIRLLWTGLWIGVGCGETDSLVTELEDLEEEREELSEELENLQAEWKAVQASLRTTTDLRVRNGSEAELEELRRETKRMQDKQQVLMTLQAQKSGPMHLMDEIAKATPDKLQLLELEDRKGQIRLVGIASTAPEIAEFAHRLEQSPFFEEVYIHSTEQTEVLDAKVKKFTITAKLNVVDQRSEFDIQIMTNLVTAL